MSKFLYIGMVEEVIEQNNGKDHCDTFIATTESGMLIGDYVIDGEIVENIDTIENAKNFRVMSFKEDAAHIFNNQVLLYDTSEKPTFCKWFDNADIAKVFAINRSS